jgi:hypothetical protein
MLLIVATTLALDSRVSQNAPKCSLSYIKVHVAVSLPQESHTKIVSFMAFLWSGHHFFVYTKKIPKKTKENVPSDHFCS